MRMHAAIAHVRGYACMSRNRAYADTPIQHDLIISPDYADTPVPDYLTLTPIHLVAHTPPSLPAHRRIGSLRGVSVYVG